MLWPHATSAAVLILVHMPTSSVFVASILGDGVGRLDMVKSPVTIHIAPAGAAHKLEGTMQFISVLPEPSNGPIESQSICSPSPWISTMAYGSLHISVPGVTTKTVQSLSVMRHGCDAGADDAAMFKVQLSDISDIVAAQY